MARKIFAELEARLNVLDKAGKADEVTKLELRVVELLAEANKISTNLIIEVDMGSLPFVRNFTDNGFHREQLIPTGLTKFEVKPVVKVGDPAVNGEEMLALAKAAGCDMDQQQGDRVAVYLNSKKGSAASKALRDAGCNYIVLPNARDVWVRPADGRRCVPVLYCDGKQCVSGLSYLDDGFGSLDAFLVPCKP